MQAVTASVYSVSELNALLKRKIEHAFPALQVQGEVSNLKEQSSGHVYFTLKDNTSQLSAVLFRLSNLSLSRPLKNGDQLIASGELTVYAPRGSYQLIVRSVQFVGLGEKLAALHALKVELEGRGWFLQERKRPLPRFPRTIGVITSPTGAVIQDIIRILERRLRGFHLLLYPVKVQGEGAAEEIARAIDTMNQRACADVLIVGRGGGSLEDLWAFNEECVASAIYRSTIPVISAVGHETDFCIADCVADLRAPTPSAAAELTSSETARELHHLEQTGARLYAHLRAQLGVHKLRLAQYRHSPFLSRPQLLLEPHWQKVDEVGAELDRMLRERIQQRRLALESTRKQLELLRPDARIRLLKERIRPLQEQIDRWMRERCARKKEQLQQLSSHLKSIDPNSLLAQGYCILFRENTTSVILSAEELSAGERLSIRLQGGSAVAQVVEVTP